MNRARLGQKPQQQQKGEVNMRTEDREVKMQGEDGKLGEPQTYNADVPTNWAEACENFGETGAFDIFLAGLKVKQDNVARNAFRGGKTIEEVEQLVAAWRPGGQRTSKKTIATQMLMEKALDITTNAELKTKIQTAFIKNDFDTIIELLS